MRIRRRRKRKMWGGMRKRKNEGNEEEKEVMEGRDIVMDYTNMFTKYNLFLIS